MGRSYQLYAHFCLEKALTGECCRVCLTLRNLRQYPVEPIVSEIASLAKITRLEVNSNDIHLQGLWKLELVEEDYQELTTEELMELHCVSQEEVMEETLSEEEVTAKQQSSVAIREMLKALETVA
ncbi:hypothetical protein AVEN_54229-1 [Araneus ventricosus]|uniref:Uncharacterized protein n=1 Tax=Araneus ventricosus TaxID=182803 RepID=A0A4Y2NCS3_ARAVE|nr:hypothetical protein AVEN_54229-1 [Araneus ventricosus]